MSIPSSSEASIKRARWLLLLPPCLPGLLMLAIGWARDPVPSGQNPLAHEQAGQLYHAGEIALAGGLLMAGFVAWKILRPPPPDEEEGDSGL